MNDRTIGVGILGTGFARHTQIPCFQATPGFEVVGLLSRSMTRAYDLAQEFGARRAFDDLDRMLKVEEIELVVVSTPPHLHLPQTLAALRAGKHVLCEKPTALHAGEALEMWQAARGAGRLHLIDHELRFDPRRIRMKEMIAAGFIGTPWMVESHMQGPFRVDPNRPWSWWSDVTQGGGALGALGSHAVDAIRCLVGEIGEVRGRLATIVKERPDPETGEARAVTADDDATIWGRLAQGGEVSIRLATAMRDEPGSLIG
jgi:predicted dehydrogenase